MIARKKTIEHAIERTERHLADLELLERQKDPAESNPNVTPTWLAQFERGILKKLQDAYAGARQ